MTPTPTKFPSYSNYLGTLHPLKLGSSLSLLNEWMKCILQKGFSNFQRQALTTQTQKSIFLQLNFQNFRNLLFTQLLAVKILLLLSIEPIFFHLLLSRLLSALNCVPAVLGAVILHQRSADYFHLVSLVRKRFWHAFTPSFPCINMRAMEKLQTVNK